MSDVINQLSDGLAAAVKAAGNGIVQVDARRRLPASGIVWSAGGLIVTADHVVRRDEQIKVGLPAGNTVGAVLVGRDPSTDLALLQVEAGDLTPLVNAELDQASVGHLALALGRPGKSVQATLGILSALGDGWRTPRGGEVDRYLQTDVVMYPGFSGGPLVNVNGELLGINTSALISGVSIAIPVTTVARVVTTLQAHGRVRRGFLGVSTQQVRLPENLREDVGQKTGLLIVAVEPGSPANEAGALLGDTIVGLGADQVRSHDELVAGLNGERVGQTVPLKIIRGGSLNTLDVVIGERQ